MTRIDTQYLGNLRCQAQHHDSGIQMITDAPRDNQGLGSSFSPTDLLATSLLTCMQTIMGITANSRGWRLDGMSGTVHKVMSTEGPRRVVQLIVDIHIPGEWDAEDSATLEKSARNCPVAQSLSPDIEQIIRFSYGQPIR